MTGTMQGDSQGQDRSEIVSRLRRVIAGDRDFDALSSEVQQCDAGTFASALVEICPTPGDVDMKKILGWIGRLEQNDYNNHLKLQLAAEYARGGGDMAVPILGNLCLNMRKKGKDAPAKTFLAMFRDEMMAEGKGCLFALSSARGAHAEAIAVCAVAASTMKEKKTKSGLKDELVEKVLAWYTALDTPPKLPSRLEEGFVEAIRGIKSPHTFQVPAQRLELIPPAIVVAMRDRGIVESPIASRDGEPKPAIEPPIPEQTTLGPTAPTVSTPKPPPSSLSPESSQNPVVSEPPKAFDPYAALRELERHIRSFERESREQITTLKKKLQHLESDAARRDADNRDMTYRHDALKRNHENLSLKLEEKEQVLADTDTRLRNVEDALRQTSNEKDSFAASLDRERRQHADVVGNLNEMVTRAAETTECEFKTKLGSMLRVEYRQLKDLEGDGTKSEREEVIATILRQMFQRLKLMGIDPSGGPNG